MDDLVISAGRIIAPDTNLENAALLIRGGRIESILASPPAEGNFQRMDFVDATLAPGFIDVHVHGANGYDTMDAHDQAFSAIAKYLASTGTTSFLATTMTASQEDILRTIRAVNAFQQSQRGGAQVLGLHLEGPFISQKNKGAQNGTFVRSASVEELEMFLQASKECRLRLMTIAPEEDAKLATIQRAIDAGITVSAGHSACDFETAVSAIDAGVTHATHLFNGMDPFHHRNPGLTGAVLSDPRVRVELIVDGVHLHRGAVQLALAAKGTDGVLLITDCMRAGNLPDGVYDLGGQSTTVENGIARLPEGNLAGSTLRMIDAVKRMIVWCGLSLREAVQLASLNPARAIGVDERKGSIALGKDADLVVLNDELDVLVTIVSGRIEYMDKSVCM